MIFTGSSTEIKMLYIGPDNFFKELLETVPKAWKVRRVNSITDYINSPSEINVILDSSIREVIDLNLTHLSKVRIVACASTGTNHIKFDDSNADSVIVYSLRDIPNVLNKLTSAAEFSFGLVIALAKFFLPAMNAAKSGVWNRAEYPGVVLKGKKLGLIGFGRIGKKMATFATSFEMDVGYYDPYLVDKPKEILEFDTVEKLVANCDFISLHIPFSGNKGKVPFLTHELFSLFKPGSYFVNTSRGELIDEAGLIAELDSGRIKGAALDVLIGEPEIDKNLIYKYARKTGANIIFTPHIAGYSMENVRVATMGILGHLIQQTSNN